MTTRYAGTCDLDQPRCKKVPGLLAFILLAVLLLTTLQAHAFTFPFTETFKSSTATGWILGKGSPTSASALLTSGAGDPAGDGWLRLTNVNSNQAGYAYYDTPIPTGRGLVITYDYGAWGGNAADGTSFFLFDGATNPFYMGAFGGSLGYAQNTAVNGLSGGYIGIGFDEFGKYSAPTEGRIGGPGLTDDAVAIRGPGSLTTGYIYLAGTTKLSAAPLNLPKLDCPRNSGSCGAGITRPADTVYYRQVMVTIAPVGAAYKVSVAMNFNKAAPSWVPLLGPITLTTASPGTLKMGFAASTGSKTNYHEVRNLTVTTLVPDLTASKSVQNATTGGGSVLPGEQLLYSVVFKNNSNSAITGVSFSDPIPTNTNYVANSAAIPTGSTLVATSPTLNVTGISIPANGQETVTFKVQVVNPIPAGVTQITNQGTFTYSSVTLQTDGDAVTDGTQPTNIGITAGPNFDTTTKTVSVSNDTSPVGEVSPGDSLLYHVVVANSGNQNAPSVNLTDVLPANTTYVNASATASSGTISFNSTTKTISWAGSVNVGSPVTIDFNVTVNSGVQLRDVISNQGTVTYGTTSVLTDADLATPGKQPAQLLVGGVATLTATKTAAVAGGIMLPGGQVDYMVTLKNTSSYAVSGVTFVDAIPANTTYVSHSTTVGSAVFSAPTLNVTGITLASGATATIHLVVQLNSSLPAGVTQISNQGVVNYDSNNSGANNTSLQTDGDAATAGQQPTVTPIPNADISVTKAVNNNNPGETDTITYTVVVTNNSTTTTATGVTVTDALPSGLTLVSSNATAGSYTSPTWTVGTLANGASATLTITATVNTGKGGSTITNSATASSELLDTNSANNSASIGLTVKTPSLSGTVTEMGSGVPIVGATVTLTQGATTCTTTTGASGAYSFISGSGSPVCNFIVGSATVTATMTKYQDATATPSISPAGPTIQNLQMGTAGLLITKTDGKSVVQPGETLTYTLTVVNNGSITANSLTLVDTLPTYLTYVSASGSGWSCGVDGTNKIITCTIGSLAVSGSTSVTLVATVATSLPDGATTLSNYAHVSTTSPEKDTTNNEVTDVDSVTTHPDLTIAKTFTSTPPAGSGSTVSYKLTGGNIGHATATGVTIVDTQDTLNTYNASSAVLKINGSTVSFTNISWDNGTKQLTMILPDLSPTDTYEITYSVTVGTVTGAPLSNTAVISLTQTDLNTGNNTASASVPTASNVDIYVLKSAVADSDPALPGGQIVYTLSYGNSGTNAAANVVISDSLPANTTYSSCSGGTSCSESGGVVTWTIGALAGSASGTASFTVLIADPLAAGVNAISNTATISSTPTDADVSNNTSNTTSTPVMAQPDLKISISADKTQVLAGDTIVYTVTYQNVGNQAATTVKITDTLLNGISYVSDTSGFTPVESPTGTYTWTIGSLTDLDPHSFTVNVTVNSAAIPSSVAANRVTISDDGTNGTDPYPADNTATSSLLVVAPYIVLEKHAAVTSSNPAGVTTTGQEVTYMIDWRNSGASIAKSVTITDTLPTGTTLVGGSITGGGSESGGGITWNLGDKAAGTSGSVSFTVTVVSGAGGSSQPSATFSTETGSGSVNVVSKAPANAYSSLPWCDNSISGTISVTQTSTTVTSVTGSGSKFLTELSAGKKIEIAGVVYTIDSVTDDTTLALTAAYAGSTASGLTIKLVSCLAFVGTYQGADGTPPAGYNDNPRMTPFNDSSWTRPVAASTAEVDYWVSAATLSADWVSMHTAGETFGNFSFFRQPFCLPLNATGLSASLDLAGDDASDIYLNGAYLGQEYGAGGADSFVGNSGIQSGINFLAVQLLNNRHGGHVSLDGQDYSGLLFNLEAQYTGLQPFVSAPTTVLAGQDVIFTVDETAIGGRRPYIYKINYGSGDSAYQSGNSFTHQFDTPGSYTVTVIARAQYGCTGTDQVVVTVLPIAGSILANSATVTYTDSNVKSLNGFSGIGLSLAADISISKTDGLATISSGAATTYTIVVSNAGPSAADGAILTDPIVDNLTVSGVTCGSPTGGAVCPLEANTTKVLLQGTGIVIPTFPGGGSVTFTVTGTTGTAGRIINTAAVAAPVGIADLAATNNSASDTTLIPPTAVNDGPYSVIYFTAYTGNVLTNDSGYQLAVGSVTGSGTPCSSFPCTVSTANGSLYLNSDGAFRYEPNRGFYGSDSFSYIAVDSYAQNTDSATLSFSVTEPAAPVANDDSGVTLVNTPLNSAAIIAGQSVTGASILGNDSGTGLTLTSVTGSGAACMVFPCQITTTNGGTAVIQASGTYLYTPAADFNGVDSFSYIITDEVVSGRTAGATVSLTMMRRADCDVNRDQKINITDIEEILAGQGIIVGPLDPRDLDSNRLIAINDANGCKLHCDYANCAILPVGTRDVPYSATLSNMGANSPYTFAVASGSLPSGISLEASSGIISGTPTTTSVSEFTVTVTETNSPNRTFSSAYTLYVDDPPLAPLAITTESPLPAATSSVAYSTTIAASGGITPYTFIKIGTLPAGLTLSSSTGVISGTPTTAGAKTFTIRVVDKTGIYVNKSFTITVN